MADPSRAGMSPAPGTRGWRLPAALFVLALALAGLRAALGWPSADCGEACALDEVVFAYSLLPRLAVGLVAGAALGLCGALLQRVLRNPLAEPSTLGIASGAQLALAAASLYLPSLFVIGREIVAMAGGGAAVALLLALTWKRGLDPVAVILCGMMLSLMAAAASAAMIIFNGDYVFALYIWGGGSLVQQSWTATITIACLGALVLALALLLLRPLAILSLDDASARALGVKVTAMRLGVLALTTLLASAVTAHLGIIAFIGLAGPALARQQSARRGTGGQLLVAALLSASLLSITDSALALTIGLDHDRIPAGAATALLGGPLLLWLLPRLTTARSGETGLAGRLAGRAGMPAGRLAATLVLILVVIVAGALASGHGPDGWRPVSVEALTAYFDWRWPRLAAACAAGAMLAGAGVILQRLSGNPLASPEILGIGAASGVGLSLCLLIAPFASALVKAGSASLGALLATLLVLMLAARSGFQRDRLLLAGVALGAFANAILSAVIAMGTPVSYQIVVWLSGATHDVTAGEAGLLVGAALVLLAPLLILRRWLTLLGLGAPVARAAGLRLALARPVLVALAAVMSAVAALSVGPLSLVGLVAPHLSRLLGAGHGGAHLVSSVLIGACLMGASDWLARELAFPYQLPLGLVASLLTGPYLIRLLRSGSPRAA